MGATLENSQQEKIDGKEHVAAQFLLAVGLLPDGSDVIEKVSDVVILAAPQVPDNWEEEDAAVEDVMPDKPNWMCSTPGCKQPSWNREPGEYCRRECRDGVGHSEECQQSHPDGSQPASLKNLATAMQQGAYNQDHVAATVHSKESDGAFVGKTMESHHDLAEVGDGDRSAESRRRWRPRGGRSGLSRRRSA